MYFFEFVKNIRGTFVFQQMMYLMYLRIATNNTRGTKRYTCVKTCSTKGCRNIGVEYLLRRNNKVVVPGKIKTRQYTSL